MKKYLLIMSYMYYLYTETYFHVKCFQFIEIFVQYSYTYKNEHFSIVV